MIRNQRFHLIGVLALALLFLMTMPVLANDVRGTVSTVNPDDQTFAITDEGGNELTFRFGLTGQVFINDKEAQLADLQAGDEVTVSFNIQDENMVADVVRSKRE